MLEIWLVMHFTSVLNEKTKNGLYLLGFEGHLTTFMEMFVSCLICNLGVLLVAIFNNNNGIGNTGLKVRQQSTKQQTSQCCFVAWNQGRIISVATSTIISIMAANAPIFWAHLIEMY